MGTPDELVGQDGVAAGPVGETVTTETVDVIVAYTVPVTTVRPVEHTVV